MCSKNKERGKVAIYIVIAIVIIVALGIGAYFLISKDSNILDVFSPNIKSEVITSENYNEIMDKIGEDLKDDDDKYYLSYSVLYYAMKDGIASAFSGNENEVDNAMYANIYGKSIQQLIDEGKQLMKDNDITLEEYKEQLKNLNENNVSEE